MKELREELDRINSTMKALEDAQTNTVVVILLLIILCKVC